MIVISDIEITMIIVGSLIVTLLGGFIITFLLIQQKKQQKNIQEKQTLHTQFQQTLLQTQLEIQEQTLKNISQEIHDNIGQVLSLAKLNISTMSNATPEALQEKIADSKLLVSKAIQDLRDLSRSLNTDYVIEMGLVRSIEYELELIKKTGSFETIMNTEGKSYRLEQQQELILFRIVQEVLHNIIKHAKATLIEVTIQFEPELFSLSVSDNGVGFDASQLQENNYNGFGLGIRNMYNRAKLIHTHFKLVSTLGEGTSITLSLPLTITKKTIDL